jgi:hypothetical protein
MKNLLLLPLLLICCLPAAANKLELEGNYSGHNLYLQIGNCSGQMHHLRILINDSILDSLQTQESAVELYLDKYRFALQTHLKIRISVSGGCTVKLLNPDMDNWRHPAEFLMIRIDSVKKELCWKAKEDTSRFVYEIQQFRWNKWIRIAKVPSSGKADVITQTQDLKEWIHSGQNKFRIKACAPFCFYSENVTLQGPVVHPDIFGERYRDKPIMFSSETHFEIYDAYGNIVMKGYAKSAETKDLPRGGYYLCYDNFMTQFTKE